ncbi:MAG TPA: DNA translocase FtsK [Vicinamibacterales bacterium]|nr:DNA translocase FtsK [Vicinamibacterales bacterium]
MKAGSTVSRRLSEFCGVTLFAAALIWLIALATYEPTDPAWFFSAGATAAPANFAGRVGAFTAELSFQLFGYASYLIPAIFVIIGWHYFWCRAVNAAYTKIVGVVLMLACISSLLSLSTGSVDIAGKSFRTGGYLGEGLAAMMSEYLNRIGSIIVILTLLFLSVILSTQFSLGRMFSSVTSVGKNGTSRIKGTLRGWLDGRRRARQRRALLAKQAKKAPPITTVVKETPIPAASAVAAPKRPSGALRAAATRIFGSSGASPARSSEKPAGTSPMASAEPGATDSKRTPVMAKRAKPETQMLPLPEPEPRQPRRIGAFSVPPLSLLDAPKTERKIDERELMDGARLLEEKCREFAVEGSVAQIHPGPVVTTFEFKPDAGVKYGKITGLADDLCLAMQAESVLIDRIPGKSTVGIQIPNHTREQISLRELLQSEMYQRSNSKLTLALGKTIHGEPYVTDLATMPHLLIAGSTGTGKSVAINSMLSSILFRASPDEVRLIMIDPKRVELGMYEDIPHLMTPVVVDPKQAVNALRWAVKEMEERYKKLASAGVRNIEQFNRNAAHAAKDRSAPTENDETERLQPLAYIVVVIDELADLMMVARTDVEESIARLAQMARAVGIHLLLATQRPSVDVITGLIKANLPSRISFRVQSKTDSRTILDGNGAEQLLGRGDMLFMPPGSSRVVRLHGPYISEQESARLASFLRKQGKPVYNAQITAEDKKLDGIEMEKDDLYDEAARIVVSSGQASISYLQRRLRIGFSRAARLVDMMEMDGLVSPGAGGKAREVLVDKGYFEEVDAQLR